MNAAKRESPVDFFQSHLLNLWRKRITVGVYAALGTATLTGAKVLIDRSIANCPPVAALYEHEKVQDSRMDTLTDSMIALRKAQTKNSAFQKAVFAAQAEADPRLLEALRSRANRRASDEKKREETDALLNALQK